MKIRKALEKAKIARSISKQLEEWNSPAYTESKRVSLDKGILEKNRCVAFSPDSPYLGAYKILRTQIQKWISDRGWNTLMVTSVAPGEGKTLTSINLSGAFALDFDRTVLLVDCDLKRQDVHKTLGISSDLGLADHLVDGRPLKDLIIWPGIEKFTLISGGRTIQESAELLSSARMKALVDEIRNRYRDRFVVFDTPPVLGGADTVAFAEHVDCIVMVVNAGKTSMKGIEQALGLLPADKFLGFILNRDDAGPGTYGYGYGYY